MAENNPLWLISMMCVIGFPQLLASPFLVLPNSIHFGACWLGSDRHVVVCEQALGKVAVIKLPGGGAAEGSGEAGAVVAVSRIVLNAEAAAMNPEHEILAWKGEGVTLLAKGNVSALIARWL
jgi:hypothetical protein